MDTLKNDGAHEKMVKFCFLYLNNNLVVPKAVVCAKRR